MQVERGTGSGQQCVLALLRRSAGMSRNTLEAGIVLARRQEARDVAGNSSRLAHLEAEVRAEHVVDIIDNAALDHGMRTAHALFCRLEAELDGTAQLVFEAGQQPGQREADRRVAVVGAGMHRPCMTGGKALLIGSVRCFSRLRHVVGIHVEANRNNRAVLRELHDAEHARAAAVHLLDPVRISAFCDGALLLLGEFLSRWHAHHGILTNRIGTCLDCVAELRKRLGYLGRRAELCPARLRMGVQVASAGYHILLHIISKFQDCLFEVHRYSSYTLSSRQEKGAAEQHLLFIRRAGSACRPSVRRASGWHCVS